MWISRIALMAITILQAHDVNARINSAEKTIRHDPYYQTGPGTAIGTDRDRPSNRCFGTWTAVVFRQQRTARQYVQWRWHLGEVLVRVNGKGRYLWQAVDFEPELPEVNAEKAHDHSAVQAFLK